MKKLIVLIIALFAGAMTFLNFDLPVSGDNPGLVVTNVGYEVSFCPNHLADYTRINYKKPDGTLGIAIIPEGQTSWGMVFNEWPNLDIMPGFTVMGSYGDTKTCGELAWTQNNFPLNLHKYIWCEKAPWTLVVTQWLP